MGKLVLGLTLVEGGSGSREALIQLLEATRRWLQEFRLGSWLLAGARLDQPPLLFINDCLIMEVLFHVVLVIEGLFHGRVDLWTEILRPSFMLVHDP